VVCVIQQDTNPHEKIELLLKDGQVEGEEEGRKKGERREEEGREKGEEGKGEIRGGKIKEELVVYVTQQDTNTHEKIELLLKDG
jgi:hypothetical protein